MAVDGQTRVGHIAFSPVSTKKQRSQSQGTRVGPSLRPNIDRWKIAPHELVFVLGGGHKVYNPAGNPMHPHATRKGKKGFSM